MTQPVPIMMFPDFKAWTDKYNLVQDAPGRISGNGALFHADFIACCESYKTTPPVWAQSSILTLEDKDNPGLLFRVPGDRHAYGHEGPDNPTGALNAGRILGNGYPSRFLKYMRATGNLFNQREPGVWRIKSDFSRFQHIIAHAQWCAGESPGLFRKLWWCIGTLINAFQGPSKISDKCLQLHLNQAARGKWWLSDICISIWEARQKKTWMGWGHMRGVYYKRGDHPMTKYMYDRWK